VEGSVNYWPRWISAIKKRTATLSLMQMGAYDRLLDHYYAEEGPLPADVLECCRIAGAVTKPEQDAVRQVLQRFFVLTEAGHTNERAEEEIVIALPKIAAAQANGVKGGRPRGSGKKPTKKPTGLPDGNPPATHEEPSLKHPHPHSSSSPTEQKSKRASAPPCPADVTPQVWDDWVALRVSHRAGVSATAVAGARVEADRARMSFDAFLRAWVTSGYRGFKAAWLASDGKQSESPGQRASRERVEAAVPGISARPSIVTEIFDVTPRLVG
jgi:uncharacterized protein YdaU (DUF1376 family)